MELEIFGVYRTRFYGSSIVMITGVFSYSDGIDSTCYTGTDLLTGGNHFYYSWELYRRLDEEEYLADITCSLENKDWYLASK